MSEKVKEVVKDEVKEVEKLTVQAAKSGAYLYPLHGLYYFLSHKSLWKPLTSKLAPSMTLGMGITVAMFLFTYVPQVAVMAFTQGPFAAISGGLLVLSESSTLYTMLSKAFLIEDALIDTFDGTLVARDASGLVSKGRDLKSSSDPIGKLGRLVKKPFNSFSPTQLVRYLMYLPLNFIPVVGTVMFVLLQGKRYGPHAHTRYFQLKEWKTSQIDKYVEANKGAYTSFGVVAVLLEMVPVASIFFTFTNSVGAALWAADLEKGHVDGTGTSKEGTTSPSLREMAKKAD